MPTTPTPAELIEIAHRFFPAGVPEDEPGFRASQEQQRLAAARSEAAKSRVLWNAVLAGLRASCPGSSVDDFAFMLEAGHDACYQARISPPGATPRSPRRDDIVVMISFIAPVYLIYTSICTMPPEGPSRRKLLPTWNRRTRDTFQTADRIVRDTTGYSRPAASSLFQVLPDLQHGNRWFGEVRLVDCLFSAHRW